VAPRAVLTGSLATAAVLLIGGCAGEEGRDSAPTASPSATTTTAGVVQSQQDIDIGGRSLYLQCWGERVAGEPTILLVSGADLDTSSWEPMAPDLAAEGHHLCAYDRAGVGRSDPAPEAKRTTQDQVTDLVALLDAADLREPVVLVAHSLGSLPAVGFVDRAPERVVGVVLVDPWSPRVSVAQRAALPPRKPDEPSVLTEERHFLNEYMFDPAQNREHLLLAANDQAMASLLDEPGPVFGDIPVVVLKAPRLPPLPGLRRAYEEATWAAIADGHEEFAAESTRGSVIAVEDTGHNIQSDQPGVVIDAILEAIAG
jgi:pimeloyl-ACP methyl ester carboxylesterase